jgi:hypothetical protein
MNIIDRSVTNDVRQILGDLYADLLRTILDLGVAPIFMFQDDRPRLVEIRERAADRLRDWVEEHPAVAGDLVSRLPEALQYDDLVESLLEAAPYDDYLHLPHSVFELPSNQSPVFAAVPELLTRVDDDGLVYVGGFDARPHGLFVGRFSLHYHQLLRRGFSSNIHYELVDTLLGIARRSGLVCARIAVDERRLRQRDEYQELFERDYWYGPAISEAKLDDLTHVGDTVHGDPECGKSIVSPYWAVSVRWTADRNDFCKTVEIEEFLPLREGDSGPVLSRYLHAIRDTDLRAFTHCDGAVKAYDRGRYPTSLAEFARRGRSLRYRKVFRLDGQMSADDWSRVTALWFRGNRLVLEYLTGLAAGGPS